MRKNAAQQSRVVMVEVTPDTSSFHKRWTSFCLPPATARCYLLSVNRNIFYVIGVIVVIVVILKVLGLF